MSIRTNMPIKLTSLLSFIFFFSGFAALIYQVVWQRLLTIHYGVGTISIILIVSVYMFGMGIGSLFGGFLAERVKHKIALYFLVELLIGFFGIFSLSFLDFLGKHTAGSSYALSFFYMFLYLSIPTVLMGITLPLLSKLFNSLIHNFLDTVSFLYFINTIGAASGAVFASYVIISFFGLDIAVYFAAAINFILAVLIYIAKYYPVIQRVHSSEIHEGHEIILGETAYILVFITGFLAIGYEIAWFRIIGVLVKASPYAFSSILTVYLVGIAFGSFWMNKYFKRYPNMDKRNLFFIFQFLIGLSVVVIIAGYYYLTKYTPFSLLTKESFLVYLHPSIYIPDLNSLSAFMRDIYSIIDMFIWPFYFMFVPTFLMGASFPLITSLALSQHDKEGKTVGTVYFFNISGNVLGGIVTGFLLLPYIGTENTMLGFSLMGIIAGLFVTKISNTSMLITGKTAGVFILLILTIAFFPKKGQLYEAMHIFAGNEYNKKLNTYDKYFEEGRDGIVMTYQDDERAFNYINGLLHGMRPATALMLFFESQVLAYVPKLENILIIGYGLGSHTESILKIDSVRKVTIVEINDALIKNLEKISFSKKMLHDKRVNLIIDDGRRFLLGTNEKFDLIFFDPLRTTTAYSNNLYSKEFFQIASEHLNKGGVTIMSLIDEYMVMPKTALSVFDYVRVYNAFCFASNTPFKRNDELYQHFSNSLSEEERSHLTRWNSMQSNYRGDTEYIKNLVARYPVNQDMKPVTEYYLGLKAREKALKSKELH